MWFEKVWFILETIIILPFGLIMLRLAGKKTIAEMTSLEIITTLSIGTLISHAIVEEGIWKTTFSMFIIVLFLIIAQLLQLKFKWFEKIFIGNATVVIREGQMLEDHLRKLRMTPNQLEMRLRQLGIKSISNIKTATIEANGLMGYELVPEAEPVTYGDLIKIIQPLLGEDFLPRKPLDNWDENNLFTSIFKSR